MHAVGEKQREPSDARGEQAMLVLFTVTPPYSSQIPACLGKNWLRCFVVYCETTIVRKVVLRLLWDFNFNNLTTFPFMAFGRHSYPEPLASISFIQLSNGGLWGIAEGSSSGSSTGIKPTFNRADIQCLNHWAIKQPNVSNLYSTYS